MVSKQDGFTDTTPSFLAEPEEGEATTPQVVWGETETQKSGCGYSSNHPRQAGGLGYGDPLETACHGLEDFVWVHLSSKKDFCITKLVRSLLWATQGQTSVLIISITPLAHRQTFKLQDHSHLLTYVPTLIKICFTICLAQNYSYLAHFCSLIWFRPLCLALKVL